MHSMEINVWNAFLINNQETYVAHFCHRCVRDNLVFFLTTTAIFITGWRIRFPGILSELPPRLKSVSLMRTRAKKKADFWAVMSTQSFSLLFGINYPACLVTVHLCNIISVVVVADVMYSCICSHLFVHYAVSRW